ncbi:hypothetical protein SAMN00120144_3158 [Hymenobacter roseosalivarius DSM 11622]|uniref:Auto-transporter adhesin head GIN domain-containing protein n=1 Tax=Hymenobacter roseosalivarius DSM 11622 TaxID=645990 RepID=A0A1W1UVE1_9BACT|nr:hypothetical protein [Hymenobacter roseosalivarius]SMB85053.1 hypothetical protein SAMN00120144_3158 [Hymenobacter roseosalivarius DSM 11622]
MKTSNKLLLTALLFLLTSLAAYNMALKTEYRKGTYKDPYKNFTALNLKDFNALEINPASILNVKVMAGPYAVWVHKKAAEYVQVKQTGQRLRLDVAFAEDKDFTGNSYAVMISCPRLTSLTTNAVYSVKGKQTIDKDLGSFPNFGVTVSGFTQDSLWVRQDNASLLKLTDNTLGRLRAVAGLSPGSSSTLHLLATNHITAANLGIRHKSQLILENVAIPQLHYQFADSAKATISGASLGAFTR